MRSCPSRGPGPRRAGGFFVGLGTSFPVLGFRNMFPCFVFTGWFPFGERNMLLVFSNRCFLGGESISRLDICSIICSRGRKSKWRSDLSLALGWVVVPPFGQGVSSSKLGSTVILWGIEPQAIWIDPGSCGHHLAGDSCSPTTSNHLGGSLMWLCIFMWKTGQKMLVLHPHHRAPD